MSQLDRALIRAYTTETPAHSLAERAHQSESPMNQQPTPSTPQTAPLQPLSRKPTLNQLKQWKSLGIRVDMPGSPLGDAWDEPAASPASAPQNDYALASKNTAAVAEALDRLMARAGAKRPASSKPSPPSRPQPAQRKPAQPQPAEPLPNPTVEIHPWEDPSNVPSSPASAAPVVEFVDPAVDSQPSAPTAPPAGPAAPASPAPAALPSPPVTTAPAGLYRKRRVTQPQWEAEAIVWPQTAAQIIDRCPDEWHALSQSIAGGMKSLALVSMAPDSGCTTIAICLAKLLAEQNRRILLIDDGQGADSLTVRLGLEENFPPQGQQPVASLYDAMVQTADQPIAVLPAGYRRLASLSPIEMQHLTTDFDVVLWDAGDRPEAWQHLPLAEGVLIVRDSRPAHDPLLRRLVSQLESRRVNIVGVADNFWRAA